jgi:hypothetical protein
VAKTPVRRLIEKGIEAGADYIPDAIETPLRRAFSIDVPKPTRAAASTMAVTPRTRTTPSKKSAEKKPAEKKKAFAAKGGNYVDPPSNAIADWDWRALEDVRQDLGDLSAVSPEAIEFGRFMQEKNQQAMRGMEPRDLLKAYGITRSSIQRQARPLATAERGGLELGQLNLDMVRPEGAFSEWLGTPAGQAYLDAAQRGQVRTDALEDLQAKFSPFGFQNKLAEDLEWAAQNLPQESSRMSDLLISTPGEAGGIADYRDFIRDKVRGVAAPKAGFVGSMLGRGDLPTFDARQIILNTGRPTEEATSYLSRRKGAGGIEAVDRLASRLSALGLEIPPDLAPYYQHLAHHSVWDKASDEATTHADLMNAMRNYYAGGAVTKDKY